MSKTVIPPQAYTRDTLAKAYEWLKTQPGYVREQASNADSLVYMYLRAQRHGENTFQSSYGETLSDTAPVSSQHFKDDLKHLAEGIRNFDYSEPSPIQPPPKDANFPVTHTAHREYRSSERRSETEGSQNPGASTPPPNYNPSSSRPFHTRVTERVVEVNEPHPPAANDLDETSQKKVEEVREGFNLSSDFEALRMLISLGYEHVLKILPKKDN
jgi:hypothetical protein